jgi:D-cysteine desulfhydrase family pyridoxal phosphate-dependent enzyme
LGGEGRCPRILIKRDDLTGLAFGGNKVRKLEFLVADALCQDATVLVTSAGVQSNHARLTAAAARVAGMRAVLLLTSKVDRPPLQGNLLLDRLLGADVRIIKTDSERILGDDEGPVTKVIAELRSKGERPYLVSAGGSTPIGTLGYVAFTQELLAQLHGLGSGVGWLYYASGSRGTQAGLELGARLFAAQYGLCGIAASGGDPEKTVRAAEIANAAAAILGVDIRLAAEDLRTDEGYIGEGYGVATPACLEALTLLAETEGILIDPVYSAKAMAGLIDHVRRGRISPTDAVVFLHTGGAPVLFARWRPEPAVKVKTA